MVRASRGGQLFDEFRDKKAVAIGWRDVGDLKQFANKASLIKAIQQIWPDWKEGKYQSSASQLIRFRDQVKEGHRVITYNSERRVYLIGTISGPYEHNPGLVTTYDSTHPVDWENEIDRDSLSTGTRNRLGSTLTLFKVMDFAAKEIESVLRGVPVKTLESDETTEETTKEDIKEQSSEHIKDKIINLDPYDFQDLVAGLLRAMGYKTRVSPPGADRGIDIIASPDGFGFEQPRIVVECKHRRSQMGSQEIRSFLGGRHKDDKGLYVSTGGFSKDARYEAERANIPLTLMDMDSLVKAVVDHYEQMDSETRLLLPLVKVYWPA